MLLAHSHYELLACLAIIFSELHSLARMLLICTPWVCPSTIYEQRTNSQLTKVYYITRVVEGKCLTYTDCDVVLEVVSLGKGKACLVFAFQSVWLFCMCMNRGCPSGSAQEKGHPTGPGGGSLKGSNDSTPQVPSVPYHARWLIFAP